MSYVQSNRFHRPFTGPYGAAGESPLVPGWGNSRAAAGPEYIAVGALGDLVTDIIGGVTQVVGTATSSGTTPGGGFDPASIANAIAGAIKAGQAAGAAAGGGGGVPAPTSTSAPPPLSPEDEARVYSDLVNVYHLTPSQATQLIAAAKVALAGGASPDDTWTNVLLPGIQAAQAANKTTFRPGLFAAPTSAAPGSGSGSWWSKLSTAGRAGIVIGVGAAAVGGFVLYQRSKKRK